MKCTAAVYKVRTQFVLQTVRRQIAGEPNMQQNTTAIRFRAHNFLRMDSNVWTKCDPLEATYWICPLVRLRRCQTDSSHWLSPLQKCSEIRQTLDSKHSFKPTVESRCAIGWTIGSRLSEPRVCTPNVYTEDAGAPEAHMFERRRLLNY